MSSTANYYSKVRSLIWPLLVVRTDLDLPIDPQMKVRAENEQRVAKQLLRLPTEGAPTALVRHVEAWGKYLQAAPSFYEEQSALGYFAPPEKPDDSKEPGLLGKIFGTIFVLAASNTFEAMEKAERQKNARLSSQVAALDKRLDKRRAERDRLEATLERLGADHVPGFKRRDYHWMQRWTGDVKPLPDETFLGPDAAEIERQLRSLPEAGLRNIEIYPSSDEYLVVSASSRGKFEIGRLDRNADLFSESSKSFPLSKAVEIANAYCDTPEAWRDLIEWRSLS